MFSRIKPFLEASYIFTSVAGASIIAANIQANIIGYSLFLVSSILGSILALNSNASRSILVVNIVFAVINIIGILRY